MSKPLLKLAKTDQVPPGGYNFTVPETGYRVSGDHTLGSLLEKVERHYLANSIYLPPNWKDLVEDQICRKLPAGWCIYSDGTPYQGVASALSYDNIMKGITSLSNMALNAVKGEDNFVSDGEAERRAEICSRCYYNMNASFCMGCGGARVILELVGKVKGSRTTSKDGFLQNCGICGCRNDAIVHVKKNILLSGENPSITNNRPAWCWLKTDDLNQAEAELKL